MNHKRRGYFAIFNFQVCGDKIRQGSEKDTERLDACFTKLGFQTEVLQNCTTAEMDRELKRCKCIASTIFSFLIYIDRNGYFNIDNSFSVTRKADINIILICVI